MTGGSGAASRSGVGWVPWETAWRAALYGPGGFYLRPEGPAGHFRTAAHAAGNDLAAALAELAHRHGCTAIADIGAGRGELLSALVESSSAATDFGLHGVDVVSRPSELPGQVGWSRGLEDLPDGALRGALVIGWELLDVVPCPILEVDEDGALREVLVEPATGRERLGALAGDADLAWCYRWWPVSELDESDRVEVGRPRDELWTSLIALAAHEGARAALAVDYGHRRETRPRAGSLTGFRRGRAVPPRPDGSMDVTAHVAMDAVAGTSRLSGTGSSAVTLTSQEKALRELGVRRAELLDPGGLGGFDWLLHVMP